MRISVLLFLIVLVTVSGCGRRPPAAKRDVPVPVVAETAISQNIIDYVDTVGRVEAQSVSTVGSQLPGRIVLMTKDVGDLIPGSCGDPARDRASLLARLDTDALEAAAKRLDAEIKLAQSGLVKAGKDWKRAQELFKQRVTSEENLDLAKAGHEAAQANVEAVRAALHEVQVKINQSSVYAPIDAVVVKKFANVGDVVSPMFSPQLYKLECIRDLKINAIVPERDVPSVRARAEARVTFDALPGRDYTGRIHVLIPSGDPVSHSFIAEIRFRNQTKAGPLPAALPAGLTPDDLLVKPGMFARVKIVKYAKDKATVVRKRCVVEEGRATFVYLIGKDGRAQKTAVTTGIVMGRVVEIVAGLKPGDVVVGRGIENVTQGQPVRVMRVEKTAPAVPGSEGQATE